ncbi:zinc-ribbon domain-containing protein [Aliiglaciecola sp. NS0011-25]
MTPNLFWSGTGCNNCNFQIGEKEAFRRDSEALHATTYPPINGQKYLGIDVKRKHMCTTPNCNFTGMMSPYNYWKKDVGCPKCAEKRIALLHVFSSEQIREKDIASTYFSEYPPVGGYTNALTPRLHKCADHGENWTAPCSFWSGTGCKICGIKRNAEGRILTFEEITLRDSSSPNFKYYPPVGNYEGALIPRLHRCSKHGENWTSPSTYWAGTGCPGCAITGFDSTKSGILYYLRVEFSPREYIYKIGITNRTVNERFTNFDLEKIKVVRLWRYEVGVYARRRETEILRAFREFKYNGERVLSSGNSELFVKDVLEMDF